MSTMLTPSFTRPAELPRREYGDYAESPEAIARDELPGTWWRTAPVERLLATLEEGVVVFDGGGRLRYASAPARRLCARGLPPAGERFAPRPAPAGTGRAANAASDAVAEALARALLTGEAVADDEVVVAPDAARGRCVLAVSALPVLGGARKVESVIVTVRDDTARRQLADLEPMLATLRRL